MNWFIVCLILNGGVYVIGQSTEMSPDKSTITTSSSQLMSTTLTNDATITISSSLLPTTTMNSTMLPEDDMPSTTPLQMSTTLSSSNSSSQSLPLTSSHSTSLNDLIPSNSTAAVSSFISATPSLSSSDSPSASLSLLPSSSSSPSHISTQSPAKSSDPLVIGDITSSALESSEEVSAAITSSNVVSSTISMDSVSPSTSGSPHLPTASSTISSSSTTHSVIATSSIKPSMSSSSAQPVSTTEIHPTSSLTPSATPSTTPATTSPPTHSVRISETNILLVKDLDSVFIELTGPKNENLDGVFLTVRNAKEKEDTAGILQSLKLTGSLNAQGLLVIDKNRQLNLGKVTFSSVVIALYSDESQSKKVTKVSLIHSLLFSIDSESVDVKVAEVYEPGMINNVYVNTSMLDLTNLKVSMSWCDSGFVLTRASGNKKNQCALSKLHSFQMKLTHAAKKNCPASHLPNHFEDLLTKEIVTKVNECRQCGLAYFNIDDMISQERCLKDDKVVAINFNVKSAFDEQMSCIKIGYDSFTSEKGSVVLGGTMYSVSNCSFSCFPNAVPAPQSDGGKIKVTVAVVVTCIGIFIVILLAVILYMKKKRRGLLQFRMTRLDEDDDDLVGDMDDFVGNQGATFSNFR